MKTKIILLLLCLVSVSSFAQNNTVTGVVTSLEDNMPVPGVNVIVQGTSNGVATNFDGNYSLTVNKGDRLEFSSLGFKTVVIMVNNQTVINVAMETDVAALDEVVVIGYGAAKKRDLTGSIVSVSGDQVADKPNTNPVASLQGKVAGLSVVNSGTLGQEPDIRIRGTISRYQTKPLYVVDGIFSSDISYINPNDIESMEVLKDPSSLAIFGVKGANGVIIVTTKKGKEGKVTVNVNTSIGVKKIVNAPNMANASLFKTLYNERRVNEGTAPYAYYDSFTGDSDWVDLISNDGFVQNTNMSLTSGNDKNLISFGLGYLSEEGLVENEKLDKLTINLNDQIRFGETFKLGFGLNGLKGKLPYPGDYRGNFGGALNATPIVSPYNTEGYYNQLPQEIGGAQVGNPVLLANEFWPKSVNDQYRFVGNIYAELNFLKNFTFKTAYYGDYDKRSSRAYTPVIDVYVPETGDLVPYNGNTVTRVNQSKSDFFTFQQEYLLTYKNSFGNHNLTVSTGYTSFQEKYESLSGSVQQNGDNAIPNDERFWYLNVFPYGDPESRTSTSDEWDRATTSYLARILYNYNGKYLLNASYRRDSSSELPPDNRDKNFWSLGAGWVVTDESFMDNLKAFDYLKIKGSIGELGNQYTPIHYPYYPTYQEGATAVFGTNVIPAYVLAFTSTPDLTWETVKSWEVGFESKLLKSRLSFDVTYYNKQTKNLLVYVTQGSNQFFRNAGEISNKGLEFQASWNDNIGEDFSYNISGNLSTVNNKVNSVFEDGYRITDGAASVTEAGYPIGYFYGYIVDGIYQTYTDISESPTPSGLGAFGPGDFKYRDVNGDGQITPDDRTMIGNPTPDFTYGFSANLKYKNFFMDMDFQGVYGNEIYRGWGNGSSFAQFNYRADRADRWTGQGTSNWEPRVYAASGYNRLPSTYMIEDGSYLRIRNLQIGYKFDPLDFGDLVTIQQMKLYLNFQNLYTWKWNSGFSPEAGGSPTQFGVDSGGYPVPVISTLGLSITF